MPDNVLCFGPNGSGKSTLLKLIAGVLTPEKGSIQLDQKFEFRASIFMDSHILFDEIRLSSQLDWVRQSFNVNDDRFDDVMVAFSLKNFLSRRPCELSEGEKQWAALAICCCVPADIYLLDEPMRALDSAHIHCFENFIGIRIKLGDRFIMTAHEQDEIKAELEPLDIGSFS